MLQGIQPYIGHFANIIATVTGIDIEVVDAGLKRIAGTGVYAAGVGSNINNAGQVCRHVLRSNEALYMETPRSHPLCEECANRPGCRETLSLYTPILYDGKAIGVIGMVCFSQAESERVRANRLVYQEFIQQIAAAISREFQKEQNQQKDRQWLNALLQIVDGNSRGIMMLDRHGAVSYLNDMAEQQLNLPEGTPLSGIILQRTGDALSGMDEFTVSFGLQSRTLMGLLSPLDSLDPAFAQALVFDSLPRFAAMLSQAATSPMSATDGPNAIIGNSPAIRSMKNKLIQVAQTPSTILITGESGTGKEIFARAIHSESDRRNKPFIAVNCGAIPDALLESELFGYVRGAFTGADPSGRMGKFELAHQGVLFLDEIGAMPLYLQVKLLRVLQERHIIRLGSNRKVDVDVRIIAATNDNLVELINQRMFRDDLYYRLNVIPFEIPPLRERLEDIPLLGAHFMDRYCRLFDKRPTGLTQPIIKALQSYAWPGNVREFENTIEYLVNMMLDGGPVTFEMLPAKVQEAAAQNPENVQEAFFTVAHNAGTMPVQPTSSLPLAGTGMPIIPLADLERQAIQNALGHYGTSTEGKRKAADALGIGIATLYRKLKE